VRRELFQPAPLGEARLLLLIEAFSDLQAGFEGRTKLSKLDFLLRYPAFFQRALAKRAPKAVVPMDDELSDDLIETRMVRFRYGPWDPAYFALLGALVGRGLVVPVPAENGIGYKTTDRGREVAQRLANTAAWSSVASKRSAPP
jgi:hypothetical protein